jgi:hypothetical protein
LFFPLSPFPFAFFCCESDPFPPSFFCVSFGKKLWLLLGIGDGKLREIKNKKTKAKERRQETSEERVDRSVKASESFFKFLVKNGFSCSRRFPFPLPFRSHLLERFAPPPSAMSLLFCSA